ncbi:MAG: polyprenyl synthetase family protein [Alphaproteobacteria bacterium]
MALVVSLESQRNLASSLTAMDQLTTLVGQDLDKVNSLIVEKMTSRVPLIPQVAGYIIAAGGKRLRPMLTLAAARLCGYTGDRAYGLAGAIEFLHTATLLHDDVVDESALRRGQDSANAVWGNKPSVLVGDFLFSRAFQIMVADGDRAVLKILSDASAIIAEGEVLQLLTANDTETSESDYLEVIQAKTAALFAAACELGAVVGDVKRVAREALRSYGFNLGIVFQLIDDVLDYAPAQTDLGKTQGDDFRDGKMTLPVILAFRRGTQEERDFWRRTMQTQSHENADFDHALTLLKKHDALRDTIKRARHYGAIARDALGIFPDSEIKSALTGIVDFCIGRAT